VTPQTAVTRISAAVATPRVYDAPVVRMCRVSLEELRSREDDQPFLLRLAQTIAWCSPRASTTEPASSLRSERFRPGALEMDPALTVRRMLYHRELDAAVRGAAPVRAVGDLAGGRLLVFFPELSLSDGAATVETDGFFDYDNVPPWDTWVGLFRDESADPSEIDYLVSWVPAGFVESVDRGINVNPEECIVWLEDSKVPLAKTLRSHGLLGS
jgi:hypothetical protein